MDAINSLGQLVEILRRQLPQTQHQSDVTGKAAVQPSVAATAGRPDIKELQQKVRGKLRRLDSNDPKYTQKSIHIFLESVLLWEFGDGLMEDPKFYALLDEVQRGMESDAVIRDKLTTLVAQLR